MTTLPPDKWFKLSYVSKVLDEPRKKLRRWCDEGRIRGKKFGGQWKVTGEEINYIQQHGTREERAQQDATGRDEPICFP